MTTQKTILSALCTFLLCTNPLQAEKHNPQFSTAGFYQTKHSGRTVASMNQAWRFTKSGAVGAEAPNFDDSQ